MLKINIIIGLFSWLFWGMNSLVSASSVMSAAELVQLYGQATLAESRQATRGLQLSGNQSDRGIAGVRKGAASAAPQLAFNSSPSEERRKTTAATSAMTSVKVHNSGHVDFHNVEFSAKSYSIPETSYQQLDELGVALSILTESSTKQIFIIEGHTDSLGSARSNFALSLNRAKAIRRYLLVKHSIDTAYLEARGLGESQPLTSNATPEGRRLNRRVSIIKTQKP